MRKVWLHQTRIGLSIYDGTGEGYLRQEVYFHFEIIQILYSAVKRIWYFIEFRELHI